VPVVCDFIQISNYSGLLAVDYVAIAVIRRRSFTRIELLQSKILTNFVYFKEAEQWRKSQ